MWLTVYLVSSRVRTGSILEIILTGRQFAMNKLRRVLQINPAYEDDDKPSSFSRPKEIANQTAESSLSSHDSRHLYDELNRGKAKPGQGSNRALFALVIIVCLISLVALLLTLLMLVGRIGSSNEGQCTG